MSRGVNKVILIGRLGEDPTVKYMPSGGAVTNASLATSEKWKDKNTGAPVEKTEWHKVVFFNRLGEIAGEYLRKGSMVYVEGSLRTRKWQAQDGTDRYTTEIVVSELQMLDGKSDRAPDAAQQSYNQAPATQSPQNNHARLVQDFGSGHSESGISKQQVAPQVPAGFDSFDDIPFMRLHYMA